ncbi:hypothetical protein [Novosphingobium sp. KN65.2]|uniref:hypothetical protein n=1 Tax=Novosphingobium sp. KN65.2 TaxID=1478134 RepID=UPI0005DE496B|nr:hypothetical protein [Novosphingobium sp. KN65.2]CDO34050.1 hypothetical protein SPHV1_100084 [Novosphingobium sp. KN65.2]
MKIKAITQIIDWDGHDRRAVIINADETDTVSDTFGKMKVDAGQAEDVDGEYLPQLDHDGDGKPGGSTAGEGDDIDALRAEYKEVLGKNYFAGWDAAELRKRIDEHKAQESGGSTGDEGDDADEDEAPAA